MRVSGRSQAQKAYTIGFHLNDLLEKAKLQGGKSDQCMPRIGGEGVLMPRGTRVMERVYILTVAGATRFYMILKFTELYRSEFSACI